MKHEELPRERKKRKCQESLKSKSRKLIMSLLTIIVKKEHELAMIKEEKNLRDLELLEEKVRTGRGGRGGATNE